MTPPRAASAEAPPPSIQIQVRDVPPRVAYALEQAGVHPLLARLFASRGVRSADELDDGLARLLPPSSLKGAAEAAVLLAMPLSTVTSSCGACVGSRAIARSTMAGVRP